MNVKKNTKATVSKDLTFQVFNLTTDIATKPFCYLFLQIVPKEIVSVHAEPPTCRPLGEVEAVSMVNFGTAGSLTGHHLSSISTAETLILSFFGHHHLVLPLAVSPPLQLASFVFRWRVVLIWRREWF